MNPEPVSPESPPVSPDSAQPEAFSHHQPSSGKGAVKMREERMAEKARNKAAAAGYAAPPRAAEAAAEADHHEWIGLLGRQEEDHHATASAAVAAHIAKRDAEVSAANSKINSAEAPRMVMRIGAIPTPASSMVNPWSPPARPEFPGTADFTRSNPISAQSVKHMKEMDRHVEEQLHKSYMQRKCIRHGLSGSTDYHNTWQGWVEDHCREGAHAMTGFVGVCVSAPMIICHSPGGGNDFMDHDMPGVDRQH